MVLNTLVDGAQNVTAISEAIDLIAKTLEDHATAVDKAYVLVSGFLVFLMQSGFAMLTAGSVRTTNVKVVLLKNILDACVGALAFFLFGYSFAFGIDGNSFIGWNEFALSKGWGTDFTSFFFQWTFAATAATIVSGSVAERTSFYAYLGYAFLLTAFVYPVASHWVWDEKGFLNSLFGVGMIDFAGCSVVHMVGGIAGIVGAINVGPRWGRFENGRVQPMPGHSATLCTIGTFVLWFGWYGFNPGSTLRLTGGAYGTVERCAVTTTLAAAAGGTTTLIIRKFTDHIFDLISVLNGVLAGLVSITASCAFVEPWSSVLIGAIGSVAYISSAELLLKLKIDDPLEAFPVHGVAGLWGLVAGGLFNREGLGSVQSGILFGGSGKLLAANLVGGFIIALWTVSLIGPFFYGMKALNVLRVSYEDELLGGGRDMIFGGPAYAFAEVTYDPDNDEP